MKIRKKRVWLDNILKRLKEENLNPDRVEICPDCYFLGITRDGDYFIFITHKHNFQMSYSAPRKRDDIQVMSVEKVIELIKTVEG